jgi:membrane dipeptidase
MHHWIRSIASTAALTMALTSVANGSPQSIAAAPIPVVDLHVDLSYQVNYMERSVHAASGQLIAGELIEAGIYGLVLPLYIPHDASPTGPRMVDIESSYAKMMGLLYKTPPFSLPGCHHNQHQVKTWFSFEGAAPFAGHPDQVQKWVSNGVKIWGLVHSHDNALASSAGLGKPRTGVKYGLTDQGRELVKAIHAAGGIVDVSHASDRAFKDIVELARLDRVPLIATHSNTRKVAYHARNLTDDQIRDIASLGGVIGMNFHGEYLAVGRTATIDDIVRHVRHITQLVGVRHVGIGSDFEGSIDPPSGLEDVRGMPRLAQALREAGYSDSDVRLIFAGNVLRLLHCDIVAAKKSETSK